MNLSLLLISCLLITLSIQTDLPQLQLSKTQFKNLIAFGDSYTDNGSFSKFYQSHSYNISKESLYPSTSEITRHTDGPTWIEYLQAFIRHSLLFNFARSGATVNNDLIPRPPQDMSMQIDACIKSNAPKDNSIYFLWMGVNDIYDLFIKYPNDNKYRQEILNGVADSIKQDLERLYTSGADHIILMGLIPLETAPIYSNKSTEAINELKKIVSQYNQKLTSVMALFQLENPKCSCLFYDMHALFQSILNEAGVAANSAITRCEKETIQCKDLVWWDNLHPSSSTHLKIAKQIYKTILDLYW